jgi:hypothetical protein
MITWRLNHFNNSFIRKPQWAQRVIVWLTTMLLFTSFPGKAQFTIHSTFGDLTECDTMTHGIYIVWWDKDFNYSAQVNVLLDSMIHYRTICLNDLDMMDPPNPMDGYYYNVYIHTPGNANDFFHPYNWGNGQGTDNNGYPFLTLPNGVLNDWVNNAHETFHIFQYSANAPGFSYSGDSQWYIEASANWFAGVHNLDAPRAFVEAESLVRVPQVPLWLSYDNYPDYYPSNWQRYVHQYAMALFLYYLTDVAGAPSSIITSGLYSGTTEKPQEYFFNQLGGSTFRNYFMDWAAHMTNQFDFISPVQASTNEHEWNNYADPEDDHEFIMTYTDSGSGGWFSPVDSVTTTAWSFNTYKVINSMNAAYTFEIKGDGKGTYGDDSHFQGKILVQNSETGPAFYDLSMTNEQEGSLTLTVTPTDTAIYFLIGSLPDIFTDPHPVFQLFPYQMQITREDISAIEPINLTGHRHEVARYNLWGQKINANEDGIQIIHYNDGTSAKIYVSQYH